MPIGSFADSGNEKETIILSRALLEIVEVNLVLEPKEVKDKNGNYLFTSDPHLNARIRIVDDYDEGEHDGKVFPERFFLKLDPDTGDWSIGENSKLGGLTKSHPKYGADHFRNPKDVDETDFIRHQFEAATEQREDRSGKKLEGTRLVWNSIGPVPRRNRKKSPASEAEQMEAHLSEQEEAEMKEALG